MPLRTKRGAPKKGRGVVFKPATDDIPEASPADLGFSQAEWDRMPPAVRLQEIRKAGLKARLPVPGRRSVKSRVEDVYGLGMSSARDDEGENLPATVPDVVPFQVVMGRDVEDVRDLNEPGLLNSAFSMAAAAAAGGENLFHQVVFRDLLKGTLERTKTDGGLSAKEAKARAKLLKELESRLEASIDAEFEENQTCGCEPEVGLVEGSDSHFQRKCRQCGQVWAGLHCAHDAEQTPCPWCKWLPAVEPQEEIES